MIYDISRELFSCPVYPGDTSPSLRAADSISSGGECNLSDITMCVHNGTHLDAPLHFCADGADAAAMSLDACMGACAVVSAERPLAQVLEKVRAPRILFKGTLSLGESDARLLAERFCLVGTEALSVGDARVHRALLGAGVAVLEGADLFAVPEGEYRLIALPLRWSGADGTPVRAVLTEEEEK